MKITNKSIHIGDGVYLKDDGFYWILTNDLGSIYLDVEVRKTLYDFLKEEHENETPE